MPPYFNINATCSNIHNDIYLPPLLVLVFSINLTFFFYSFTFDLDKLIFDISSISFENIFILVSFCKWKLNEIYFVKPTMRTFSFFLKKRYTLLRGM